MIKLKHRINIEERIFGNNDSGWFNKKKVWGLIERVTDGVDYSNIGKQITHKITFRYDPTISITKHRFSYDNRLFQIKGIFDMREEKFFLHAYVSEVIKHDK